MSFRSIIRSWLPRTLGGKCLLGLGLGLATALIFKEYCHYLDPMGSIFIRASQIVVMPYMIFELLCSLGELSDRSLKALLRTGGVVFLSMLVIGIAANLFLPTLLPSIRSSAFYNPSIMEMPPDPDILGTYLPYNIYTAMAQDNFPAVVLFTAILGIVLQSLPGKQSLLTSASQLRKLFSNLNKLVVKLTPYGVFALSAVSFSSLDRSELLRMHAMPVIAASGVILVITMVIGLITSLTPFSLKEIWGVLRGPLTITASSANLIIALPLLIESIKELLANRSGQQKSDALEDASEQVSALIPAGFVLPNLGQVFLLVFLPFLAWYTDKPMKSMEIINMMITSIASVVGGIRMAIQQGILHLSMPRDLINIFILNSEWTYRLEKSLSLIGLLMLAFIVISKTTGKLSIRPARLATTIVLVLAMAVVFKWSIPKLLTKTLEGTYTNDKVLMSLRPLVDRVKSVHLAYDLYEKGEETLAAIPSRSTSLDSIRAYGVLRVAIRTDAIPWAYKNADGQIVGYDMDMIQSLAQSLDVDLELVTAPKSMMEKLISTQKVDIAVGGFIALPDRASKFNTSQEYQQIHLALVVNDDKVRDVQDLQNRKDKRPVVIAYNEPRPPPADIQYQISKLLGEPGPSVPVVFRQISGRDILLDHANDSTWDALLTTAESGAAWAVIHPQMTMLPVFRKELPSSLVIVIASDERALSEYIDSWIGMKKAQDLFEKLYHHWVMAER
jgi:Na+/H+-dicarboxylate symporter/ABC-type amino acid transport substrate-binding protein